MSIDIQVKIESLPHDKRYRKIMPHHRLSMNVCSVFVNAKIIHDDGTATNNVSMQKISVHVQQKYRDSRKAPHNGEVEENRLTEPFAVDEDLRIVDS